MKNDITSNWNLVIAEQYLYNTNGNIFDYFESKEIVPVKK